MKSAPPPVESDKICLFLTVHLVILRACFPNNPLVVT